MMVAKVTVEVKSRDIFKPKLLKKPCSFNQGVNVVILVAKVTVAKVIVVIHGS
jgi:hypothetical protein